MGVTTLGMSPLKLFSRYQNKITGKVDLGDTGLSVSPLCYGASRTQDATLMRYALDQGINFIDTGRSYANGKNEEWVGKVIREERHRFIIQTMPPITRPLNGFLNVILLMALPLP